MTRAADLRKAVLARVRPIARTAFYHRAPVRWAALPAVWWKQQRFPGYALSHLAFYDEDNAVGPVQRDEALLLFALTRVLRPQVVVEVGFLGGQSSFNFLQALAPGARLYSFDIDPTAERIARETFEAFPNFRFRRVSQEAITPEHVDRQKIGLLFLDASHDLDLNQRTFDRLAPMLEDDGVLAVHDTGAWRRQQFGQLHQAVAREYPQLWASDDDFEHRREERRFVNWVLEERPGYAQLHLHSRHTLRHGMTLLQRRGPLLTGAP